MNFSIFDTDDETMGVTQNGAITYSATAAVALAYNGSEAAMLRRNLEDARIGVKSCTASRTAQGGLNVTFRVVIDWACNDTDWIREKVRYCIGRFGEGVGVFEIGRTGCKAASVKAPATPKTPPPKQPSPSSATPPVNPPPSAPPNDANADAWIKQYGMYIGAAIALALIASRRR